MRMYAAMADAPPALLLGDPIRGAQTENKEITPYILYRARATFHIYITAHSLFLVLTFGYLLAVVTALLLKLSAIYFPARTAYCRDC